MPTLIESGTQRVTVKAGRFSGRALVKPNAIEDQFQILLTSRTVPEQ